MSHFSLTDPQFTPILRVMGLIEAVPRLMAHRFSFFLRKLGNLNMKPYFLWH